MSNVRKRVRIVGIVQGVGFRPFIFNLALEFGLSGWVTNDSAGVLLEVEGIGEIVQQFLQAIPERVPPLARIDSVQSQLVEIVGETEFVIRPSDRSEKGQTLISPDMAICPDCQREMLDPTDRRYLYPFINCTNCGPRFTIIQEMPYDRPFTTMGEFPMCPACQQEYEDPRNRRFHAQPNACPVCGPQVWLTDGAGKRVEVEPNDFVDRGARQVVNELEKKNLRVERDFNYKNNVETPEWAWPMVQLRRELAAGKIAGVKGLGGYHLVCDATHEDAVAILRQRKVRPSKPLAVMMANLEQVRRYCVISAEEAKLLTSPSRPIVLLKWKEKGTDGIAQGVADAQSRLGVMLPYTPLHHLLFDEPLKVLVMTSGNISGEPIIYDDQEVVERLGHVVDYFLMHNRAIVRPCDDSVQRWDGRPVMMRRSRGYAPLPMRLVREVVSSSASQSSDEEGLNAQSSNASVAEEQSLAEPLEESLEEQPLHILAAGGELKNTFALSRGGEIFLSQHIGDLKTRNSNYHYRQTIDELLRLLEVTPKVVAYDLHPGYLSTKYVQERFGGEARLIGVQHHHAHLASCMAEQGVVGPVIGFAFDGTGYGLDEKIWGGEVLVATATDFQRWAHLRYLPLPGGDQAVKEPWRIGAAYLEQAGVQQSDDLEFWRSIDLGKWNLLRQMMEKGLGTPETSSMGRLFDAVAAIVGVRSEVSYEGQAAMELEELARGVLGEPYSFSLDGDQPPHQINPLAMIGEIAADLKAGVSTEEVAQRFHGTIVEMATQVAVQIRQAMELSEVALSGGVFQNRLLASGLVARLEQEGFTVYQQSQVPANDGGLALGQMYVAMHRLQDSR